jgi:hypothetical protein
MQIILMEILKSQELRKAQTKYSFCYYFKNLRVFFLLHSSLLVYFLFLIARIILLKNT